MTNQPRFKGRFIKKSKLEWRKNIVLASQKRKGKNNDCNEPVCSIQGRRIISVAHLAKELWCKECDKPLSLRNIESEYILGLASVFKIKCPECLNIYSVRISNFTNQSYGDSHRRQYSVNTEAVTGMINAGIIPCQLNALLDELEIPKISKSVLQRHECIVEETLRNLGNENRDVAHQQENILTEQKNSISSNEELSGGSMK